MKGKFLSLTLVLCLLISIFGVDIAFAETSGTCGYNLTWTIEEDTLYINGTGEMTDYLNYYDSPWKFRQDVKEIVVGEGVTKIGEQAFRTCVYATKIKLPKTLTEIGRFTRTDTPKPKGE